MTTMRPAQRDDRRDASPFHVMEHVVTFPTCCPETLSHGAKVKRMPLRRSPRRVLSICLVTRSSTAAVPTTQTAVWG